jgi:hypothetical protein
MLLRWRAPSGIRGSGALAAAARCFGAIKRPTHGRPSYGRGGRTDMEAPLFDFAISGTVRNQWRPNHVVEWYCERIVMNAIFALLALSALMGLFFGRYFSWIAILVSAPILAVLSATVLQNEGFGFFTGIAIIVACLTVSQIAYWIGLTANSRAILGLTQSR